MKEYIKVEKNHEYQKWYEQLPFFNFPSYWYIKIIPPFGGAIVRFQVMHKWDKKARVSVYFDAYDNLAKNGSPYWEISPYPNDNYTKKVIDCSELVSVINESLEWQRRNLFRRLFESMKKWLYNKVRKGLENNG